MTGGGGVWTLDTAVVTFAKMADIATARFIGRVTAATGAPESLTGTQATTLLDEAVQPSDGGPGRADGQGAVALEVGRVSPAVVAREQQLRPLRRQRIKLAIGAL